jgi:hypothetical protein
MHDETIRELTKHLSLKTATWKPERAASMRMLAKAYKAKGDQEQANAWMMRACAEAPGEREPWVDLSQLCYETANWSLSYAAAKQALAITERPMTYMCEPAAWGSQPLDLLSIAAWNLGMKTEGLEAAKMALNFEPDDARIRANVVYMTQHQ